MKPSTVNGSVKIIRKSAYICMAHNVVSAGHVSGATGGRSPCHISILCARTRTPIQVLEPYDGVIVAHDTLVWPSARTLQQPWRAPQTLPPRKITLTLPNRRLANHGLRLHLQASTLRLTDHLRTPHPRPCDGPSPPSSPERRGTEPGASRATATVPPVLTHSP